MRVKIGRGGGHTGYGGHGKDIDDWRSGELRLACWGHERWREMAVAANP